MKDHELKQIGACVDSSMPSLFKTLMTSLRLLQFFLHFAVIKISLIPRKRSSSRSSGML